MKFRNQSRFKNHYINRVINKPLMHKRGKQWIIISLSALMLFGLGTSVKLSTHAHADTNQPQSAKIIQNKAAQLNGRLLSTASANQQINNQKYPSQQVPQKSKQITLGTIPEDNDQNTDSKYNFDSSDQMYDTSKNDYLNNVNNLTTDSKGQSIRTQIRLTYGFNQANPSQPNNNVAIPSINQAVITDLNNSNIGILPLYSPGNSIRQDGMIYPRDTALYYLNNIERPEDSVGYQKMIPEAKAVGYLLTAPRNTDFTSFFNRYFYLKNNNGMPLDQQASEMSTTNNYDTSNPNNVYFPNVPNTNDSQANYDGGTIDLEYAPQNDTIVYTYNNQPVGGWTSSSKGSTKAQDPELLKIYDSIQQNNAPGMPSHYQISDTTFNQFLNELYNQSAYQQTHTTPGLNYGQHYTIPVVLPESPKPNVIKYMYNGQQVGEWTSPSTGNSTDMDNDLVNFYNTVSSTNAPSLPNGYYIPDGPTLDHPEYTSSDNPLNDFFQEVYPNNAQNTDTFEYGRDYTINVDVPYSQLHVRYFENGRPADLPKQSFTGKVGNTIGINLVNQFSIPSGYHLQNVQLNGNTTFMNNSQEIDVNLVPDKTNTITKTVPGPTRIIQKPNKTVTKYINVPGPTKIEKMPGKTITKVVYKPSPTKTIYKTVTKQVPGPTKIIQKSGKTIIKYVNVPGPTKIKKIPGNTITKVIRIPSPIVYKTIIKPVAGPTKIIHEPGKTVTKYINVPGPLKIKKVPGNTITKVVYIPSPAKIIYKNIVRNVPSPAKIKYVHVPCKCQVINHTKIVYIPKIIKEFIKPKPLKTVKRQKKTQQHAHHYKNNKRNAVKPSKPQAHISQGLHIRPNDRPAREIKIKTPVKHLRNKQATYSADKLPQTGELHNYSYTMATVLIILSLLSLMIECEIYKKDI